MSAPAVELAAKPGYRRTECRCGCGVWFYASRDGAGHPRWYVNADHERRERNRRRQSIRDALRALPPCPYCAGTGRVKP